MLYNTLTLTLKIVFLWFELLVLIFLQK